MEAILKQQFRTELQIQLQMAGISEKEANQIITKRYKEQLKRSVLSHLRYICDKIENDKYKEVFDNHVNASPGGDIGCDNYYINFNSVCELDDIGDVLAELDDTIELYR